jgi:hypothetical protein
MSDSFHVKFSFSGFIVLKWHQPIFTFLWLTPLWRGPGPLIEQTWFPSTKNNTYQVLLILACWFRRRFSKIFSVILLFCYYLPLEKSNPLHLSELESTSPKDDLCQVWLELALWFWRRFLKDPILFLHFFDYLPLWRGPGPLSKKKKNLNSLHPRLICTKFDWFWPAGSGKEDFWSFSVHFYFFTIISPWRSAILFVCTNLNPLSQRMICAESG